jgi:PBSX family phage terminase large subunit
LITSPKQDKSFTEATHRFNIWVGSIRAGKTFASIRRILHELKYGPPGDVMFLGVNRQSIDRNILVPMYDMIGFPVPNPKTMKSHLYGRNIYFVGCPDISAVSTIKGSTLALGYVDEITEIPEAVFKMFEGRLSVPGAKLLGTTNPDGPSHWFKKQYIDNAENIDLVHWDFTLDDNPTLDAEYKKRIKASYTGLWYNRYILGQWALASGAIFDTFDNDNIYTNPFPAPSYYVVGIDYGTTNATAAVLVAITPNKWPQMRVEAEYYYDSAKIGRAKTDDELVKDILEFISYKNVSAIYVDPAAASFKIALRQKDLPVIDANNDVLLGIKTMSKFVSGKNLVIHRSCKTVIEQIQSYAWCPKAAANGEDKPIKKADHIVDACRYSCTPFMLSGDFGSPDQSLTIENLRRKVYEEDQGYGFMNQGMSGGYF